MYWFMKGRPDAPIIKTVENIEIEKWRFEAYEHQASLRDNKN